MAELIQKNNNNHTLIKLKNKSGMVLKVYEDICISSLNTALKIHDQAIQGFYQYQTTLPADFQQEYVAVIGKLWFFKDYLKDPEQIVKEKGILFNFEEISGFHMYCVLSMLRFMEEHATTLWIMDREKLKQKEIESFGNYFLSFVESNVALQGVHSCFQLYQKKDQNKKWSYNNLIKIPKQQCLRKQINWNHDIEGKEFHAYNFFKADNTQ